MASHAVAPERATHRTVVLLRPSEKLKLEQLASSEKLTTAEVIRRFIQHGDAIFQNQQEEQVIEAAMKIIAGAVAEANESMTRTMAKVDRLHEELVRREADQSRHEAAQ